jgi:hypothetical protein
VHIRLSTHKTGMRQRSRFSTTIAIDSPALWGTGQRALKSTARQLERQSGEAQYFHFHTKKLFPSLPIRSLLTNITCAIGLGGIAAPVIWPTKMAPVSVKVSAAGDFASHRSFDRCSVLTTTVPASSAGDFSLSREHSGTVGFKPQWLHGAGSGNLVRSRHKTAGVCSASLCSYCIPPSPC